MPQNQDTWLQEQAINLPSFVNNVVWRWSAANQSCKCDCDTDTADNDDCDDSGMDDGQGVNNLLQN